MKQHEGIEHSIETFLRAQETLYAAQGEQGLPRRECCGKSRRFLCPQCRQVVADGPAAGSVQKAADVARAAMPFAVDIVLHDQPEVATGLHLAALSLGRCFKYPAEVLPKYDPATTAVLYPSPQAVPIQDVASELRTLVVLDCKWSRPVSVQHTALQHLRHVQLGQPPSRSSYWRWHNEGAGMLCTLEAVLCAAWEVHMAQGRDAANDLVGMMVIYGLQRAAIRERCLSKGTRFPWCEESKAVMKDRVATKGTERQKEQKKAALKRSKEERQLEDERHHRKGGVPEVGPELSPKKAKT